jgi:hypothetical protein
MTLPDLGPRSEIYDRSGVMVLVSTYPDGRIVQVCPGWPSVTIEFVGVVGADTPPAWTVRAFVIGDDHTMAVGVGAADLECRLAALFPGVVLSPLAEIVREFYPETTEV